MPLIERKKLLSKYKNNSLFVKSAYIIENGISLFEFVKKEGLEGIVAKKINSTYEISKRTTNWIKIKNIKEKELYIGAYIENKTKTASLVLGEYQSSKFIQIVKVIIGKRNPDFIKIKQSPKANKSYFENFFEEKYIYIKPTLKCIVTYTEETANNSLRHSSYKELKLN